MKYPKINIVRRRAPLKEGEIEINEENIIPIPRISQTGLLDRGINDICSRTSGELRDRGVYLSDNFDWLIVTDDQGSQVLIAMKKGSYETTKRIS